jgi:hypothetical protein
LSNALARRFKVDVSPDNTTWTPLLGLTDFNPQENATLQGADDYDSNGFASFEKTITGAKLAIKARRKLSAGAFDPGQELCRNTRYQFGTNARLYVRWYDRNGAPEAYSGLYLVDYQQSKTGVADIEEVGITFTADGQVSPITNPASAPAVPVITTATPSGAATGALVTITGAYFTGVVPTTGVKFGGVNATNWTVVSDSTIVATMPTGSAGSAPIIVTNGAGASNSFAYTRG